MHLIHYVHFIFTRLGSKSYLVYQVAYVVYRVIAGSIQLVNVHGSAFVKRNTGVTNVAGLPLWCYILTINCFCQYTGTGSFTNTTWTAKQKSMRQLLVFYSIFKRSSYMTLTHNGIEQLRTVLAG